MPNPRINDAALESAMIAAAAKTVKQGRKCGALGGACFYAKEVDGEMHHCAVGHMLPEDWIAPETSHADGILMIYYEHRGSTKYTPHNKWLSTQYMELLALSIYGKEDASLMTEKVCSTLSDFQRAHDPSIGMMILLLGSTAT